MYIGITSIYPISLYKGIRAVGQNYTAQHKVTTNSCAHI